MIDFTINWTNKKNDMCDMLATKLWINKTLTEQEYLIFRLLQAESELNNYQKEYGE